MNEGEPKADFFTLEGRWVFKTVDHGVNTACVANEKVVHEVVRFKARELPNAEFRCV